MSDMNPFKFNVMMRMTIQQRMERKAVGACSLTFLLLVALFITSVSTQARQNYQKPPKGIQDILDAPVTPGATISPTRDYILLAADVRYPPLAELAEPVLRLAGLRINPNTNGLNRAPYSVNLKLIKIADGSEREISLPPTPRISFPLWSPDGKRFLFSNTTESGIELWVGEAATGKTKKLKDVIISAAYGPAAFGPPARWMPDSRTLLVHLIPANRGTPPAASSVPTEPNIRESSGKLKPARTYQDLLKNPSDERLFDYYATSQLAFVEVTSDKITHVGQPAVFQSVEPSPDGKLLLVTRVKRPYSYLLPHNAFPKDVEVWDAKAKTVYRLVSLPLADQVPIEGVLPGPRNYGWRPTAAATLVWVEALDGGDPAMKVPQRDRLMSLDAPFDTAPRELARTEHRLVNLQWGESKGLLLVTDYDRDRRWIRTTMLNADGGQSSRVLWSLSVNDRYNNPGVPLMRVLPNGYRAILQHGDSIYLNGLGASPNGEYPFLDRFNLDTLKTERLFQSGDTGYEAAIAVLDDDGSRILTRRERADQPLNLYVRALDTANAGSTTSRNVTTSQPSVSQVRALTRFVDTTPQLREIKKQLITYNRSDGVQCFFTLYLPPGYKEGMRLPTVVWAYPLEYTDAATAGQVTGSTQRFTTISGASPLFFALAGYAVLHNTSMPVIGDPQTVNNTFVEQLVMSAKAAVDKAVEMGVTDPERVGIGGHSYGAFMTANLLAHSDIFRAGIAMSGAYNRTLTPFGFQNERRTLWEAPELYIKVSPFMNADKIREPLLLLHGESDNNEGTFPLQSERLYQAISGTGGTVRLVTLPLESHIYGARQSIEHVLHEMLNWFDKHVKNAQPRVKSSEKAETPAREAPAR